MIINTMEELPRIAHELLSVSDSVLLRRDNVMLEVGGCDYHFLKSYMSEKVVLYIDDNRIGRFDKMAWTLDDKCVLVSLESEDINISLRFEEKVLA